MSFKQKHNLNCIKKKKKKKSKAFESSDGFFLWLMWVKAQGIMNSHELPQLQQMKYF